MMSLFNATIKSSIRLAFVICERRWTIIGETAVQKWASSIGTDLSDFCGLHYRCFSTSCRLPRSGTVDGEEVAKFDRAAGGWWNKVYGSENVSLHTMNSLRVPFIRDGLVQRKKAVASNALENDLDDAVPLSGLTVLDVGCGGGILSEPLARLGANVTGLDASSELINIAVERAKLDSDVGPRVSYICSSVEKLRCHGDERFDGVVASEIVEHVADVDTFVSACCSLVKPGGSIFFTTMNKTWCSYMMTIVAAERLLGIVPPGTHDWNKYVSPDDLRKLLTRNKMMVRWLHGMTLNPVTLSWSWIENTDVNYALHAIKQQTECNGETNEP